MSDINVRTRDADVSFMESHPIVSSTPSERDFLARSSPASIAPGMASMMVLSAKLAQACGDEASG
jgi:hypothetical protein